MKSLDWKILLRDLTNNTQHLFCYRKTQGKQSVLDKEVNARAELTPFYPAYDVIVPTGSNECRNNGNQYVAN